jgi:hypothetical protein
VDGAGGVVELQLPLVPRRADDMKVPWPLELGGKDGKRIASPLVQVRPMLLLAKMMREEALWAFISRRCNKRRRVKTYPVKTFVARVGDHLDADGDAEVFRLEAGEVTPLGAKVSYVLLWRGSRGWLG